MNEHNTVSGVAARFTKKPVTIEAIQWTGRNLREIIAFTNGPPDTRTTHAGMAWDAYTDLVERDGLKIYTLEGKMLASPGDWIIKGVKGEFYPCKPDIFEATYSRAALADTPAPKTNQCGEVCERAKLCAICARGLEDTTATVGVEPAAETLADHESGEIGYCQFLKVLPNRTKLYTADQDTALIRQLVDALEAMQSEAAARFCGLRICDEAIALGRARLDGKSHESSTQFPASPSSAGK